MNRAVLEACLPLVLWMAGAFVLLRLAVRFSGAKLELSRLRQVHRCQQGGVQTLSFVLTLPIFIMLVLFIIQVSQLMIGVVGVHYAAFAAARAAAVWVPAQLTTAPEYDPQFYHPSYRDPDPRLENILPVPLSPQIVNRPDLAETPVMIVFFDQSMFGTQVFPSSTFASGSSSSAYPSCTKYQKIFTAAVLGCATIAPSRDLFTATPTTPLSTAVNNFYQVMDPSAAANTRIPRRIDNKIAYSMFNTAVEFRFVARDIENGPTYNPLNHPTPVMLPPGNPGLAPPNTVDPSTLSWVPSEVGWNDPMTITVIHDFALLPGPGRFLSQQIVGNSRPDLVATRIRQVSLPGAQQTVYTTRLTATCTVTNEGIKSLRPYFQAWQ